jgi:hypothetical protein
VRPDRLVVLGSNSSKLNPHKDMIAMAKKKPAKKTKTEATSKKKKK